MNNNNLQKVFDFFMKKENIILILGIGLLLLIIVMPTNTKSKGNEKQTEVFDKNETLSYLEEYTEYLENKLIKVLENYEGAGKASVMITLKNSEEVVEAKNSKETETEVVVVKGDNGGEKPIILKTKMPSVEGVVVRFEGKISKVSENQITQAISALFSIESHKIKVIY